MEYIEFPILEVAQLCNLDFHPKQNLLNIEIKANCPFCHDRKYHLGINRAKNKFHCFHCNERGNSVSLFARIHGITNKEAVNALKNNEQLDLPSAPVYIDTVVENPIRPLMDRHNVYYDFLQLLRLTDAHRKNLLDRGLAFDYIHQNMYKSIPLNDVFRREVLEELSHKHNLMGIPGFYRSSNGDWQMYMKKCGGFFVPVCDKDGYIQGLQIRLDDEDDKKYRWFSSKHYTDGTPARGWIHVVGDIAAREAFLTEGGLKGDIASALSGGALFLCVPGVNAIEMLPEVLKALKIKKVFEAWDMDKRINPQVKKALIQLKKMLNDCGVVTQPCSWNKRNGIDEYYLYKNQFYSDYAAA